MASQGNPTTHLKNLYLSFISYSLRRREHSQIHTMKSSFSSVQFSSVTQSCPILCDPMNRSIPGLPVHHKLPEVTQTQVHRVSDTIQPSHPLSSPSLPAPNPSQHQSLFQWVSSARSTQFLFIQWYSSKSLLCPGLSFLFLWTVPISKQTDYNGTSH